MHSTGDCVAVRTRLPVAGVVPDSPASNGWRPGFMTDLMAKDLDLALAYGARCRGAPQLHGRGPPGPHRRLDRRLRPRGLLGRGQGGLRPVRAGVTGGDAAGRTGHGLPALVLAADHRARGVMTIERYADYLAALRRPCPTATGSWPRPSRWPTWPGSAPSAARAADLPLPQPHRSGRYGLRARRPSGGQRGPGRRRRVVRGQADDPYRLAPTPAARRHWSCWAGSWRMPGRRMLEALIEPVMWRDGRMSRVTADIVLGRGHRPRPGGPTAQGAGPRRAGRAGPDRGGGPGGGQRGGPRAVPRRPPPGAEAGRRRGGRGGARRHGRGRGRPGHRSGHPPGAVTGRRRPGSWPRSCTPGDPHPRLRDQRHQGGAVGPTTAWWPRPGFPSTPRTPADGRAEQDPAAVVDVRGRCRCRPALGAAPGLRGGGGRRLHRGPPDLGAGRRRTARSLGPAIVWSDRRAGAEAEQAATTARGPGGAPPASGIAGRRGLGGGQAGLAGGPRRRPSGRRRLGAHPAGPRGRWRLTGEVATDPTMASRSGLYDLDGRLGRRAGRPEAGRLAAPGGPPDQVTGVLTAVAGRALGLAAGTPVVIGAGDRACEVLGTGATATWPMVSWGTTANVSVPVGRRRPCPGPAGHRAVAGGRRAAGCSRAGCRRPGRLVAWLGPADRPLGRGAGRDGRRRSRPVPGAWWPPRGWTGPGPRGGEPTPPPLSSGCGSAHGLADLARAAFEAVAWEVQRCLEAMAGRRRARQGRAGHRAGARRVGGRASRCGSRC